MLPYKSYYSFNIIGAKYFLISGICYMAKKSTYKIRASSNFYEMIDIRKLIFLDRRDPNYIVIRNKVKKLLSDRKFKLRFDKLIE